MIPGDAVHDFCTDDVKTEDRPELDPLKARLAAANLPQSVSEKLFEAAAADILDEAEIDDTALEVIREIGEIGALACLQEVVDNPTTATPKNRVAYLCGMMKTFKMRPVAPSIVHVPIKGPDSQKIEELKARLGLPLEITSGQRHLGPSPDWTGPVPSNEIFIGHLPYDIFEDELIPLFEPFGSIYDARIMLDPSGQFSPPPGHKGFAFINFVDRHSAEEAIQKMNGLEIRGKKMKVNPSFQNTRIFIGNLPKNKTRDEIMEDVLKATEGCIEVIVYPDINDDRVKNRGFCFADYDCHKNASAARRRFSSGQGMLFGRTVVADWADPITEPDQEIMSKVKVLYVKNLKEDVTEEVLSQKFSEFGPLEKCKKIKDYAFVTYKERPHALQALQAMHGFLMGGVPLDVTLARPQTEEHNKKKEDRRRLYEQQQLAAAVRPTYGPGAAMVPPGYAYGGWGEPVQPPRMRAPAPAARGARGAPSMSKGFRGARGGPSIPRGARGGSAPFRGAPRPPMTGTYAPPRPPAPPPQAWGPPPNTGYGGYTGGYAVPTDQTSIPPLAEGYYTSPYESYDYSAAQQPPPPPPPPLYPAPVDETGAAVGGYPPGSYVGGYAAPYMAYDYSHAPAMAPGYPPYNGYAQAPSYAPPRAVAVHGKPAAAVGRGAPVARGAVRGGVPASAASRPGMKRPQNSNPSNGRGGGQAKQLKMSPSAGPHPPPLFQPSSQAQNQGGYADMDLEPPNGYHDHGTNGTQQQQQQQQQPQQWYNNNFSEGWQ